MKHIPQVRRCPFCVGCSRPLQIRVLSELVVCAKSVLSSDSRTGCLEVGTNRPTLSPQIKPRWAIPKHLISYTLRRQPTLWFCLANLTPQSSPGLLLEQRGCCCPVGQSDRHPLRLPLMATCGCPTSSALGRSWAALTFHVALACMAEGPVRSSATSDTFRGKNSGLSDQSLQRIMTRA